MGSPFLKTDVTSDFLSISGKVPLLIQLLKMSVNFPITLKETKSTSKAIGSKEECNEWNNHVHVN